MSFKSTGSTVLTPPWHKNKRLSTDVIPPWHQKDMAPLAHKSFPPRFHPNRHVRHLQVPHRRPDRAPGTRCNNKSCLLSKFKKRDHQSAIPADTMITKPVPECLQCDKHHNKRCCPHASNSKPANSASVVTEVSTSSALLMAVTRQAEIAMTELTSVEELNHHIAAKPMLTPTQPTEPPPEHLRGRRRRILIGCLPHCRQTTTTQQSTNPPQMMVP